MLIKFWFFCKSKLYYFLIPFLYFVYIFYIRLILVRMPKTIFTAMEPIQLVFTIFVLMALALRLYYLLKIEGYIKTKELKNTYIKKIYFFLACITKHIEKIKLNFYLLVLPKSINANVVFLSFLKKLHKLRYSAKLAIFVIVLETLPKCLVILCFILDVFIFHQFNFFYKVLGLLLLPLLYSIITYILVRYHNDNCAALVWLVTSEPILDNPELHGYDDFCFIDKKQKSSCFFDINDFINNRLCPIFDIPYLLYEMSMVRHEYNVSKINLIITISYMLGWSAIFVYGVQCLG